MIVVLLVSYQTMVKNKTSYNTQRYRAARATCRIVSILNDSMQKADNIPYVYYEIALSRHQSTTISHTN